MSFLGYAFPTVNTWSIEAQGGIIVGVILVSAIVAVLRFRVTQNLVNVVFLLYGLAIAAMLITLVSLLVAVLVYLMGRRAAAQQQPVAVGPATALGA